MRKNLTRTGRHSLPVIFMELFILATGVSAQATGKISIEGRNTTFASVVRNANLELVSNVNLNAMERRFGIW
jgi:hypothetical protein